MPILQASEKFAAHVKVDQKTQVQQTEEKIWQRLDEKNEWGKRLAVTCLSAVTDE